ncbi:hypothetical protein [uncultured Chloroflexus sp.]|uniref:hypothetical protein n=1 Tax=uncultured Chloroflexus sp. TaxID=214040 RepID=UPI0026336A61|nr:hypothetical protein [uncultured Chloroflexus sp.]
MPTFFRYVTLLTILTLVLAGAVVATPAAMPVAAAMLPVAPLLTADGTLRTDGLAAGALDLRGWDVNLDPTRGPLFRPATQASSAEWEHLGQRTIAAISSVVTSIVFDGNGNLYIGGTFQNAAGIPAADYLVMWNPVTQQWSALGSDSALNGYVEALYIDENGHLYVGGRFTNAAGIAEADYIARWDGTNWSALGSSSALNDYVGELYIDENGHLYVGGGFTNAAGIAEADYIARWDGTNWSALGSNGSGDGALNGAVNAIVAQGSYLYIGGNFTDAAGIAEADHIARWDGTNWSALGSNGSGDGAVVSFVHTVLATADKVYVGGMFTDVAGINTADYVAVWDPATGQWSALGSNGSGDGALNAPVNKLALFSGNLYVGGNFTDAAGQVAADYLAVWDGSNWTALGNDAVFNALILEVVIDQSGNLYVGGNFSTVVGQPLAQYVAVWRGSSWAALGGASSSALDWGVSALAVAPDGKVYVGGGFTNAGGNAAADYVAVWNPATGQWSALGSNGSGDGALNSGVSALVVAPDGKVYVGGWFTNAGGNAAADYVAVWNPATGQWSALGSNGSGDGALNDSVLALAVAPDGEVYVGGGFTNAGNNPLASYVASYRIASVFRVFVPAINR